MMRQHRDSMWNDANLRDAHAVAGVQQVARAWGQSEHAQREWIIVRSRPSSNNTTTMRSGFTIFT
jgi:hypothetical protein